MINTLLRLRMLLELMLASLMKTRLYGLMCVEARGTLSPPPPPPKKKAVRPRKTTETPITQAIQGINEV